jgi:hypothetical protein
LSLSKIIHFIFKHQRRNDNPACAWRHNDVLMGKTARKLFFLFLWLMLNPAGILAEYISQEILIIPWGNEANQLMVTRSEKQDVNFTPDDTTDDFIWPGAGPSQAIVDDHENIYINSTLLGSFKCFDSKGNVLFNYTEFQFPVNPEFYLTELSDFYVDSAGLIYMVDAMGDGENCRDLIAVADHDNNLVDRLSPFGSGSGVGICSLSPNSNDVITVATDSGYYTYQGGEFKEGGSLGPWMAKDGYYYGCRHISADTILFRKFLNPDKRGHATWQEEHYKSLGFQVTGVTKLGVSDDMRIFLKVAVSRYERYIQIYDTTFKLLDQFQIAPANKNYFLSITAFMRPSDGNIYEFRCLDDGLHVVRWSKE